MIDKLLALEVNKEIHFCYEDYDFEMYVKKTEDSFEVYGIYLEDESEELIASFLLNQVEEASKYILNSLT